MGLSWGAEMEVVHGRRRLVVAVRDRHKDLP